MYGNMPLSLRTELWDNLLALYHETLIVSLTDILKCNKNDDRLKPYSLDKFLKHFSEYAFICFWHHDWNSFYTVSQLLLSLEGSL